MRANLFVAVGWVMGGRLGWDSVCECFGVDVWLRGPQLWSEGPLRGLRSGLSGVPARGPFPPSCEEAYIGQSTLTQASSQLHAVKRRTVLRLLPTCWRVSKTRETGVCMPSRFGLLAGAVLLSEHSLAALWALLLLACAGFCGHGAQEAEQGC